MQGLTIRRLKGNEIHQYINNLAHLRMSVFREYPYLYEGNLDYELNYLKTYMQSEEAILVAVIDNNEIVGASTAIPLIYETKECQKPFIDNGLEISDIFYLGESVLLAPYRNKGIYKHFFKEREGAAVKFGCKTAAFCAVSRENDPRCPKGYVPLNDIWQYFGYKQDSNLCAYYEWQEINEAKPTTKPMIFWTKPL